MADTFTSALRRQRHIYELYELNDSQFYVATSRPAKTT